MTDKPIILFDGVCNFCDATVNFIIRHDKKNVFKFAALQSAAGQRLLEQFNLPQKNFESVILIDNAKAYQKTDALLRVFNRLSLWWKWLQIFWIIPGFVRNGLYHFFARNRYKLFGKKDECMIPTPAIKARFLS